MPPPAPSPPLTTPLPPLPTTPLPAPGTPVPLPPVPLLLAPPRLVPKPDVPFGLLPLPLPLPLPLLSRAPSEPDTHAARVSAAPSASSAENKERTMRAPVVGEFP
jgi:hypothetical protein